MCAFPKGKGYISSIMIIDQHHHDGVIVNRELMQTHPVDIQADGDLHTQQTIQ